MSSTNHHAKILAILLLLFGAGCEPGCPPPPGGFVDVIGPQREFVFVQRTPQATDSVCCKPVREGGDCRENAGGDLSLSGRRLFAGMVDGTKYIVIGVTPVGCSGSGSLPCSGTVIIRCEEAIGAVPVGTITIVGPGVECFSGGDEGALPPTGGQPSIPGVTVCNTTTITLQIANVPISVTAREGSTASGIAQRLATSIALDPTLFSLLTVSVSANVITVSSRDPGVENSYPWQTSCSSVFPYCGFEAELSPIATLAPG